MSAAERRSREAAFSVSALFKSMSGTEVSAEDKPKSNGLKPTSSSSSSFVRNGGRLQRLSGSKKDSLKRLGLLFSRMNGHLPESQALPAAPAPPAGPAAASAPAYSISDGLLPPQGMWQDLPFPGNQQVTRSETHLNQLGMAEGERANGRDSLLLRPPACVPPALCFQLHCLQLPPAGLQ
ncbi:hypothetical protein AAFF_G00312460 [Aldrovandia affinis]|uniref:Uncharacterized protein n=1 Tax=Aldrovandia affinis TaxID=143900 RepID=A0AAD7WRM1_9TELE|nr:hypothetical protein AAFF_G00312460 [Aldrovandia affinis]